jgi:hypothetical protein
LTVLTIVPAVPATVPAILRADDRKLDVFNGIFGYPHYTYLLTLLSADIIIYMED